MFPSHEDSVASCAYFPFPCISAPKLGWGVLHQQRLVTVRPVQPRRQLVCTQPPTSRALELAGAWAALARGPRPFLGSKS